MVDISYRGELQKITGKRDETVAAEEIRDVLRHIRFAYGTEAARAAKRMLIVVNNESILLREVFRTKLEAGDVVAFLPISAGG